MSILFLCDRKSNKKQVSLLLFLLYNIFIILNTDLVISEVVLAYGVVT